jgi:amino acid transporter
MGRPPAPLTDRHLAAVALGSLFGAGVFYVPNHVENLAGPATPLAYLAATGAVCPVAVAYAVFLSSPLGDADGGPYLFLSRTWHSRPLGFLVVWPAVGGYVALLALLAAALGAMLAATAPVTTTTGALVVLAGAAVVHGLGPAVAGRVQLALTGFLVVTLLGSVVVAATVLDPSNFSPLLPTPRLRNDPLGSLSAATAVALVGVLGFEVVATATGAARTPRRSGPRALVAGLLGAGGLAAVAAFVTFGVIPWWQLTYARAPFADAVAAALSVDVGTVLAPATALATASALLALLWAPSRLLVGFDEMLPSLARRNRFGAPDLSVGLVAVAAGVVVVSDALSYALYLSVAGLAVQYVGVTTTAAVLPVVRPALYERCRLRPRRSVLAVVGVVAALVASVFLWRSVTVDPGVVLGQTRWSPALSTVRGPLLHRPTRSVLPALLAWELLGVATYVVAADYRDAAGVEPPTLSAAYEEAE